jgi:hypothetical protein
MQQEFASSSRVNRDGDVTAAPQFAWLSRAKVAAAVDLSQLPGGGADLLDLEREDQVRALQVRLRALWEPHRDYIADVLSVALSLEHWSAQAYMDPDRIEALNGADLVRATHELACRDLEMVLGRHVASFRVQLIATALVDRDPALRESLREAYAFVDTQWSAVYEHAFQAHGLTVRPGVTLEMFTNALTALAEGLAMRLLVEPDAANLVDPKSRTSLLGTCALALAATFTRVNSADNRHVEDVCQSLLGVAPVDE